MFTDIRVVNQSTDDDHLVCNVNIICSLSDTHFVDRETANIYMPGSRDRDEFSFS
jgi:hypothetical protein